MPKRDHRADLENLKPFIGIGLMLVTGLGFAISVLIISMAIKSGVGVSTSNAIRYLVAAVTIYTYHKITKRPIKIPPRERFSALALGITVFMMGIGYIGATKYIPVSLAVLIFYTGPIFIVFISRFTEKESLIIIRLTALGSFSWLVSCLGGSFNGCFSYQRHFIGIYRCNRYGYFCHRQQPSNSNRRSTSGQSPRLIERHPIIFLFSLCSERHNGQYDQD